MICARRAQEATRFIQQAPTATARSRPVGALRGAPSGRATVQHRSKGSNRPAFHETPSAQVLAPPRHDEAARGVLVFDCRREVLLGD